MTEIEAIDGARFPMRVTINPRARRISIRIDVMRRMAIVIAPSKRQVSRALAFAGERAGWIARELSALPAPVSFAPGARVPLRGVLHELVYEAGRQAPRVAEAGPQLIVAAPQPDLFAGRVKRFFKAEALKELGPRVDAYCAALRVCARVVNVKEMRSRWGSCSSEGVLSFSWRVIFAPPFVLDYIAAHEVAHLREMNHSRRFWAHVGALCPGHAAARAWFRTHGAELHLIGEA